MASSAASHLTPMIDANVITGYNYPTNAAVEVIRKMAPDGTIFERHVIEYNGTPGSSFDNAPLTSTLHDYTNGDIYVKQGASTWTVVGSAT